MNQHGLDLQYPIDIEKDVNGLAEVIDACAASRIDRDQLMEWFDVHKTYIEEED